EIANAERLAEPTDAFHRLRRVERHFQHAKAGIRQRMTNAHGFVGTYAAQDRDERQRIEPGAQHEEVSLDAVDELALTRPVSQAICHKPCAAASSRDSTRSMSKWDAASR